jgi:hypothetical protein
LAHYQAHQVAGAGAQGHPHAEFLHTLADGVGDYAVDSGGGQRQRDYGEKRNQEQAEAVRGEGAAGDLVHQVDVRNGEVRIEVSDGRPQGSGEGRRVGGGADDKVAATQAEGLLPRCQPECRLGGGGFGAVLDVAGDADDRRPGGIAGAEPDVDALADGLFIGPVAAGHRLIDDHDRRSVGVVMVVEETAGE